MQNFKTVPKTGTFGGAVDKINENFLLANAAIGDVEYATRKNKGLFASSDALNTAIPSPKEGDWALVGTSLPATIYVCNTDGTWAATANTYGDTVNLNDYVTKTKHESDIADLEDELSVLDDYGDRLDDLESRWQYINLANPAKFTEGKYVRYEDGGLSNNALYKATGYIAVVAGEDYYFSFKHQMAWYNSDREYISGSNSTDTNKVQTAPAGAAYVRASVLASDNEYMIAQSSVAIDYVPYSEVLHTAEGKSITERELADNAVSARTLNIPMLWTMLGNNAARTSTASLTSGNSLTLSTYPNFIKKCMCLSMEATVGTFDTIFIGKGYNQYRGRWIKITTTSIIMQNYESSVVSGDSIAHGLTIDTYLVVTMYGDSDGVMHVMLQTKDGNFKTTLDWKFEANYEAFVRSDGSTLTNVKLCATNMDFRQPVWAFGDSYFGVSDDRVIGQLKNFGFFNYLVDALAGLGSVSAYADFIKALNFGTPKYLVWCLGMNDSDENFQTYFTLVKQKCESLGITLIGCTIPSVPERSKETISQYVRTNATRYIDAYSAVGANSSGVWYTGYLSNDNLHPTTKGARAIAARWLVDFPELMQYNNSEIDGMKTSIAANTAAISGLQNKSELIRIDYWQSSAPNVLSAGVYWYDTTNNVLKVSYTTIVGTTVTVAWETVTGDGDNIYVDATTGQTYYYNNNAYRKIGGSGMETLTQAQYSAITPTKDVIYNIYEEV